MWAALCVLLTVVYVGERYRALFQRLVALHERPAGPVMDPMPRDVESALRVFGADWATEEMHAKALEVYADTKDWSQVRAWVAEQRKTFGA